MSTLDSIRQDALSFLKKRDVSQAGLAGAAAVAAPPARRPFSAFDRIQAQRAGDLVSRFMTLADQNPGEAGLEEVLKEARAAEAIDGLGLVKHALSVFIVHHNEGGKLPLPRLWEREPHLFARQPAALRGATGEESVLDWYREDPFYNEHHEHWHIVYPIFGVDQLKDRQGELFVYMHEQMLARYNTERLAAGLDIIEPFDLQTTLIPEGYDSGLPGYTPRPANQELKDVKIVYNILQSREIKVSELRLWGDRLSAAVEQGTFSQAEGGPRPVDADLLGATVEPSMGSANSAFYGNLHNDGHMIIAYIMEEPPITGETPFGVMGNTATAIMDPIFFRWHRHIDNFSYEHQETQPANDFSDAPNVLIRDTDIILAFADQVPADEPDQYGEQTFGGDNWDQDFSDSAKTTSELTTKFETGLFTPEEGGAEVEITYLEQDEFVYFIRLENQEAQEQTMTMRIWLVAEDQVEERRMWIEMDTFQTTLAGNEKKVIYRPANLSSVIKKENGEGQKPPTLITRPGTDDPTRDSNDYCDCGWPYNLLLPKGTAEGMEFRLMVMCTQDDIDLPGSSCGSVSLCGTRGAYPDPRPMGYPFCNKFEDGIEQTIANQDNMGVRDIQIRFVEEGMRVK